MPDALPQDPARPTWRRLGKRIAFTLATLLSVATVVTVLRPVAVSTALARARLLWHLSATDLPGAHGPLRVFTGGAGSGVLLIHDLGDDASVWTDVIDTAFAHHRVAAVDLPGHGGSAPSTGPLTARDVTAGVERAAAQLGAGAISLVGHGAGGWLALDFARHHPTRVSHLVLINAWWLPGDEIRRTLMPHSRDEARLMTALLDGRAFTPPDFVLDDLARHTDEGPIARLLGTTPDPLPPFDPIELHALAIPVTIIWSRHDALLPPALVERLRADLPRATLIQVDACGHVPMRECPGALADALAAALGAPVDTPR